MEDPLKSFETLESDIWRMRMRSWCGLIIERAKYLEELINKKQMARYILIYIAGDEYDKETEVEFFSAEEEEKMHKRVNELAQENEIFNVIAAGFLQTEYEYTPVEIVKKYEPKTK